MPEKQRDIPWKLIDKLKNIYRRLEAYPGRWPETFALLLYITGVFVISYFHEPWFDEAVAWDIARDTPLKDILFYVPRYEGHPPFWHLVLLPFAKSGAPYELSLTLINLAFAGTAVGLILFCSPFPRPVKLLLPFTYFFFYQYGVISRPYSMMMLAFVLLAMAYPGRNKHPGRYVLSLMLLCAASAYGILLAGGITLAWLWEIRDRENIASFARRFVRDRRAWLMLALLIFALALLAMILPEKDTYATSREQLSSGLGTGLPVRLLYTLVIVWADAVCTNVFTDQGSDLASSILDPRLIVEGTILGMVILLLIFYFAHRKKTLLLFVLPATLFNSFSAVVYLSVHHIGIVFLFAIFWLWCSISNEDGTGDKTARFFQDIARPSFRQALKGIAFFSIACMLLFPLSWTFFACIKEVRYIYSPGRNEAAFIKQHNLERFNIWGDWRTAYDEDQNVISLNFNYCSYPYTLLPYFDRNIFSNSAYGTDGTYTLHVVPDEIETRRTIEEWKAGGEPDILMGYQELSGVYSAEELSVSDYTPIYFKPIGKIWKGTWREEFSLILMKKELAKELNLNDA